MAGQERPTWANTLNAGLRHHGHISRVTALALRCGYPFFTFNDGVRRTADETLVCSASELDEPGPDRVVAGVAASIRDRARSIYIEGDDACSNRDEALRDLIAELADLIAEAAEMARIVTSPAEPRPAPTRFFAVERWDPDRAVEHLVVDTVLSVVLTNARSSGVAWEIAASLNGTTDPASVAPDDEEPI